MGNRTITLNVDTAKINSSNVDACCNFGQLTGITNEDYTIQANLADTVTWQGVSSNAPSTDIVNIVSIDYEEGENIFNNNRLMGTGDTPEKVIASIVNKTPEGEDYKYKISFTVFNNGVQRKGGEFQIDPKIQVH